MKYRDMQIIKHSLIKYRDRDEITLKEYMQETGTLIKIIKKLLWFFESTLHKDIEKNREKIFGLKLDLALYETQFEEARKRYEKQCVERDKIVIHAIRLY